MKYKNKILIGLLIGGILIAIFSIAPVRSQIAERVGISVWQTPTRPNDVKDAAQGDNLTNGLIASGTYLFDGVNWDRARATGLTDGNTSTAGLGSASFEFGYNGATWDRLLTSTHGDNLTTSAGLNTAGFLYAFDGVNWDRVRATGLTDANATAAGVGMAAFPLMWNGATWDLVRGTIANGLLVNVSALPALVGNKTPADGYANPADSVGTWALGGMYNGATWDRVRGDTISGLWANIKTSVNLPVTTTGNLPTYTTISSTLSTNQVAVGAGAGGTLIRAINPNRRSIIIRNQDTQADMYIGINGVTIATGLLVKALESVTLDRNTAAIYGITAAANIVVGYLEE